MPVTDLNVLKGVNIKRNRAKLGK